MADTFESLRSQIKLGNVLTPGEAGYEESISRWSQIAVRRAKVVVQPHDANEVSVAIKYATAHKIPLVIAGGGHSTSGSSSVDDGLLIDLNRFNNKVTVDTEASTVTFGGGCRWKEVDEACAAHGLATIGGTVNHTGVGGLVLGGGYGWMSGQHGLAIDLLISVEMVLADGRIVTASETENPDLFWAVRGAGQQFGAITNFTSRAYKQGDVWSGPVLFTIDKISEVVAFANYFHQNNTGKEGLLFAFLGGLPEVPMPCFFCLICIDGTKEEGEAFFKPLLDIGPIANMTRVMPYEELNNQFPGQEESRRRLMGGASIVMPLDEALVQEAIDTVIPFAQERGIAEGTGVLFELIPNEKIREVENSATAFAARGDFYQIGTIFLWDDEKLDQEIRLQNRKVVNLLKSKGYKGGVGQYNNYDAEYIDPVSGYGDNLSRLRELKTKYDPNDVFYKRNGFWPSKTELPK